jgi:hypothetical protein
MSETYYFAYGANMSRRVFVERRGIRPLSVEPVRLDGWELSFALRGVPFVEPAWATIRPAPDGWVEGTLYGLDAADLAALDLLENGYRREAIEVVSMEAGPVRAWVYRAPVETAGLLPSRRYLQIVIDAARERGASADYLARLEAQPAAHVPVLSTVASRAVNAVEALHRRGIEPLRWLNPLWRVRWRRPRKER